MSDQNQPPPHDPSLGPERPVGPLLDAIAALVVVLDGDGAIVAFNRACEQVSGHRRDDVTGRPFWEVLGAADQVEAVRQDVQAARGGESAPPRPVDWIVRDGRRLRIAWSYSAAPGERGAASYVVASGRDVSAEASFRGGEDRLRAIVNTAVDSIVTIDRGGVIESFNPAAEKLFGYRAAEAIGRNVDMLMPEPYHSEHAQYVESYLRTGVAKIIGIGREVVGLRKDGTTFPMDLAVSEVEHLGLFVGVVRDLTERRRAEEQLRQADRLASIGSLAAGLGHDMNNVLLPMRGRLDALEAADLPQKPRQHLRAVRESVSYLQQLTDALHLLALDPLDEEASARSTDIAAWWDQVGPLLQRSLPRHVRVGISMPSDLRPVAVAPHRLTQVVLNLLVNAGDAVGADGHVRIAAAMTDDGAQVRFTVSDDGPGMPAAVRSRAMEAFFTTKDRGRGTGLGLALVRGIVTSAGGTVDIDSEPGRGTCVVLTLPVREEPTRLDQGGAGSGHGAPPAAVVSIDDERIATLISTLLEKEGLRVSFDATADPAAHAIWITSPADADVSAVQRFLKAPGRQVIACGPDAFAWARLGALVIEDVADFEVVRDRIERATRAIEAR